MTLQENVDLTKEIFVKFSTKAAMTAILAYSPYLDFPVVRFLIEKIVSFLMSNVANNADMGAFFIYTDLRVSKQGRDFLEKIKSNKEAQKNGTEEQKKQSENDLENSFRSLIKLTN